MSARGGLDPRTEDPIDALAARILANRAGFDRPTLVGLGGGVSAGKSAFAAALAARLRALAPGLTVEIVAGDGFLKPNATLAAEGLMGRKGFPESFDAAALEAFFQAVAAGAPRLTAPTYSHAAYDVHGARTFDRPDLIVFEGVNALAWPFDYGVYLDADEADLEAWYVARFLDLGRQHAPRLAERLAAVGGDPAALARAIWREVNLANLRAHIAPTRARADAVVVKGPDHAVRSISFR